MKNPFKAKNTKPIFFLLVLGGLIEEIFNYISSPLIALITQNTTTILVGDIITKVIVAIIISFILSSKK